MGDNLRTGGAPAQIYTQTQPEIKFDINAGVFPNPINPTKPKIVKSITKFNTNADKDYTLPRQYVGRDEKGIRRQVLVGIRNDGMFYYVGASNIKINIYKNEVENNKHKLPDAVKLMLSKLKAKSLDGRYSIDAVITKLERTYKTIGRAHVDSGGIRYSLIVGKRSDGIYYIKDNGKNGNNIVLLKQAGSKEQAFETAGEYIKNNDQARDQKLVLFEKPIPVKLAKT